MSSPLAPVLANIFMGFHESKWLNEYNLNKPKFYLRYVDDILAAFDNEQDSLNFLNFLNNRHPNIKSTIEKQNNHSIAFLDVFISGIHLHVFRIMIENEIYCYVNGFLKWNISRKTSYVIGNKKFFGKICILDLRSKRKGIFARVIIRN